MRPLAGAAGLATVGASILVFALTADVWKTAGPFRVATLTSKQALTPPASRSTAPTQTRPAKAQHRRVRAAAESVPKVVTATSTKRPTGRVSRRAAPDTSRSFGAAAPVRAKALSRRRPPPVSVSPGQAPPVPPAVGGAPTPAPAVRIPAAGATPPPQGAELAGVPSVPGTQDEAPEEDEDDRDGRDAEPDENGEDDAGEEEEDDEEEDEDD
jgi:hypothetical protein